MILYELICDHGHKHESWFRDSGAFDALAAAQGLTCPVCGSTQVTKALMAPRLARRKGQPEAGPEQRDVAAAQGEAPADAAPSTAVDTPSESPAEPLRPSLQIDAEVVERVQEMVDQVRRRVEQTCDYVGDQFAEEARRIHYGESDVRGIYGEATPEETEALMDEGVEVMPLPTKRRTS